MISADDRAGGHPPLPSQSVAWRDRTT